MWLTLWWRYLIIGDIYRKVVMGVVDMEIDKMADEVADIVKWKLLRKWKLTRKWKMSKKWKGAMAKPKPPSAALWRINLSQCPWRAWSWLDNTHCMQKYAAVAEKNKKYCSLRTKFESSNKNNPTDWKWFKEKQKQISLFASFLLESKTVSKKCPELQIQQRGGWPSWHQFLLGQLFANCNLREDIN